MKKQIELGTNPAICQKWEESEAGWGVRPDGFSLHVSLEGLKGYIQQYWARMPDSVPDEYSRPSGTPYPVAVSDEIFTQIVNKGSLRYYEDYQYPGSGGVDGWTPVNAEKKNDSLLRIVEEIARGAHAGQLYGGEDYVEIHIVGVVKFLVDLGYDEKVQAVAWLHDSPEDAPYVTEDYMLSKGVDLDVVTAALILNKANYENQDEYRQAVAANPLAAVVKIADSLFNLRMILQGVHSFSPERAQEKIEEYLGNIAYLVGFVPAPIGSLGA